MTELLDDDESTVVTVPRTLLIANNKGGVGKSSIAASLGVQIAAEGHRVLLVDADPQGNLTTDDLGVPGDDGRALVATLQLGHDLEVVTDVRPRLDLVPGGQYLASIPAVVNSIPGGERTMYAHLGNALLDLYDANGYDIIIIDSGPGDATIMQALMAVSSFLLIPTRTDPGSIKAAKRVAKRYIKARRDGSDISFLGMVLFAVNPAATKRNAAKFAEVEEMLGSSGEPFRSTIRHDAAISEDARAHNATPFELVAMSAEAKRRRLAELSARRKKGKGKGKKGSAAADTQPAMWSRTPQHVAADYAALKSEVITRINAASEKE